jgi:lipopolysaccharide-induced tumor necrosis factor-alpha factor
MGNPNEIPAAGEAPPVLADAPPAYAPPAYSDPSRSQPYPPAGPAVTQQAYPPQPAQPLMGQPVIAQPLVYNVGHQPVTVQPVVVTNQFPWGSVPQVTVCPHCQSQVTTRVSHENGLGSWISCAGICILGCWLGCCLIPFCVSDLQDHHHHCPNCNKTIYIKKLIS